MYSMPINIVIKRVIVLLKYCCDEYSSAVSGGVFELFFKFYISQISAWEYHAKYSGQQAKVTQQEY